MAPLPVSRGPRHGHAHGHPGSGRPVYVIWVFALGVVVLFWLALAALQTPLGALRVRLAGGQSSGRPRTQFRCLPLEPEFTNPNFTTCEFTHLVLWDGQLYVLDPDITQADVPTINVDWFLSDTLPLKQLSSLSELGVPPSKPIVHVKRAVIAGFQFYHNFYHAFAEYAPAVHSLMCRMWGACEYDPSDELAIVMANKPNIAVEHLERPMIPAAMQCVTNRPVLHLWHTQFASNIVVFDRVLVGFGPECRADHFHCQPWEQRRPPPHDMMDSWRTRVARCIGFDEKRVAPVDPIRIIVVDRPYETGRHFINVDQMIDHLRSKYGSVADVSLHYLEGTSMAQQAALYNNATIVIWNHGAAMGNLIYAPHNAAALQIVFMPTPEALFAWPEELVRDLAHNVTLRHMVNKNPDRLLLRAGWVRQGPEYKRLTSKEKLAVWEKKECPTAYGEPLKVECDEFWVKIAHTLEVDLAALDAELEPLVDYFAGLAKSGKAGR